MKIHAIQTGTVRVKPSFLRGTAITGGMARAVLSMMRETPTIDLPIYAYAIEHSEGVIVVDTGALATTPNGLPADFFIKPEEEIGPQLERLGIRHGDISRVVLTHVHSDHAEGLPHLRGLPVWISREEHDALFSTGSRLLNRLTPLIPENFQPTPIAFLNEPFGAFARSFPLTKAGDVVAVPTPGHTAGHLSVIAVQNGIHYFIAGDASYSEEGMLKRWLQGPSMALRQHPATLDTIYAHTQQYPTVYLPAHDFGCAERLANCQIVPQAAQAVAV